jgi:sugar phosphate isomerase/epimerase
MKIGICTDPKSLEGAGPLPVDYFEVGVQSYLVPLASEAEFEKILAAKPQVPVIAANGFLPGNIKSTGASVDLEKIDQWAAIAFRRAARVGIKTVVFGSGGSRQIQTGFPRAAAVGQFVEVLRLVGSRAQEHGVTVVVEPLNSAECNFINSLREGAKVLEKADHPAVKLLADIYHMTRDKQPPEDIEDYGHMLAHVHAAENARRSAPGIEGDDFRSYLQALRKVGYTGNISMEAAWGDMLGESIIGASELRKQIEESGFEAYQPA